MDAQIYLSICLLGFIFRWGFTFGFSRASLAVRFIQEIEMRCILTWHDSAALGGAASALDCTILSALLWIFITATILAPCASVTSERSNVSKLLSYFQISLVVAMYWFQYFLIFMLPMSPDRHWWSVWMGHYSLEPDKPIPTVTISGVMPTIIFNSFDFIRLLPCDCAHSAQKRGSH